jgi:hypothetical protein
MSRALGNQQDAALDERFLELCAPVSQVPEQPPGDPLERHTSRHFGE